MMGCTRALAAPIKAVITASFQALYISKKYYNYLVKLISFNLLHKYIDIYKLYVDLAEGRFTMAMILQCTIIQAQHRIQSHQSFRLFKGEGHVQRT